MDREVDIEKEFSENIDRMLAGEEVKVSAAMDDNCRTALDFAQKLVKLHAVPPLSFKAQLKERLLLKLSEAEATSAKKNWLWDGLRHLVPRSMMWRARDVLTWGLMSRQPTWKTVIAGVLAVALIAGLVIAVPSLTGPSPTALASEIARRDPQVQEAIGSWGEITVLKVEITGQTAHVLCGRETGAVVEANVNLKARTVTSVERLEGLFVPELTEAEKAKAINIALADPRVKEILDKGGRISKVFPSLSSMSAVFIINDRVIKLPPTTNMAIVQIESEANSWLVHVNLDKEKVERIIEPQSRIIPPFNFWNIGKPL